MSGGPKTRAPQLPDALRDALPPLGAMAVAAAPLAAAMLARGPVDALLGVAGAALTAAALAAEATPAALAFGAAAAWVLLGGVLPPLEAAALAGALLHAPRLSRAPRTLTLGLGAMLAAGAGALAQALPAAYAAASSDARLTAVATAGLVAFIPLAIRVDDAATAALVSAARAARGERRVALLRALARRRSAQRAGAQRTVLDAGTRALAQAARQNAADVTQRARRVERAHHAALRVHDLEQRLHRGPEAMTEAEERLQVELEALREAHAGI